MEYDYWPPSLEMAEGAPVRVLVLMHGRGASRQDLSALRPRLPRAWHVVVPDAPHPGSPWGYGPGRAWYKFLGDDRPEHASLQASLREIDRLVEKLPDIISATPTHIVMGGFSQGGTMGNAFALTRKNKVRGVLNFSGFLPSTLPISPEIIKGTRFFWGHGVQDMNIPFALAERGRATLQSMNADLDSRDYMIGHWIDPDELRDASSWLSTF